MPPSNRRRNLGLPPTILPNNKQPAVAKTTKKLAWIVGDLAKGGISKFLTTIIPELNKQGIQTTVVVYASDVIINTEVLNELLGLDIAVVYEKDTPTEAIEKLLETVDIISITSRHPAYTPINYKLPKRAVSIHSHGGGEWTHACLKHEVEVSIRSGVAPDIVAISEYAAGQVSLALPQKARVLKLPVSTDDLLIPIDFDPFTYRQQIAPGSGNDNPWILYTGRISPEKQLEKQIAIVREMQNLARNVLFSQFKGGYRNQEILEFLSSATLVWCGTGVEEFVYVKDLMQEAKKLGQHFIHIPWVEYKEIPKLMASADLCICTSEAEGVPTYLVEAMICGCPIASTDIGVIPELPNYVQQNMIHLSDGKQCKINDIYGIVDYFCHTYRNTTNSVAVASKRRKPAHRVISSTVSRLFGIKSVSTSWAEYFHSLAATTLAATPSL